MTQIVTEPRTTEERAARLREFYEADCAASVPRGSPDA